MAYLRVGSLVLFLGATATAAWPTAAPSGPPPARESASPHDPVSEAENREASRLVRAFRDWDRYPYQVIVVPGFTPLDAKEPVRLHPIARFRLEAAKQDFDAGKAPFLLVSGGNVHPPGTPVNEALEMKAELVRMGVPADRIIVDAKARHSTTNLRNAGRYMLEHGLTEALVTTSPEQAFYFAYPVTSTFHARCLSELGYVVGKLRSTGIPGRVDFRPSTAVLELDPRDPLDP